MERSGTVLSRERVQAARLAGIDVLPLRAAVMEEPAPHVVAALRRAAATHVMYPIRGMPELRSAIAAKLLRDNGIVADPETEILVTNGAKQALHLLMAVLLRPGDQVVYPLPSYVYDGSVMLGAGTPRPVSMSEAEGYAWDAARIEGAVTPRTRVLLLNTPCNPTGYVATAEALVAMADVALRHDLLLVVDQSHEKMVYDGRSMPSMAARAEVADRTVTVFSMTKAHNLQGYRVGYMVGPRAIIEAAAKVLEWSVLANNFLSQVAALAVLTGPQGWLTEIIARCERNRDLISEAISGIDGIEAVRPAGGAHHFINVARLGLGATETARRLLYGQGIPSDPGEVFGKADYLRLGALPSQTEVVMELLPRLRQGVAELRTGSGRDTRGSMRRGATRAGHLRVRGG